jgi:uncharacterized membrane protein YdjX (TVP38/TMEM64 family)
MSVIPGPGRGQAENVYLNPSFPLALAGVRLAGMNDLMPPTSAVDHAWRREAIRAVVVVVAIVALVAVLRPDVADLERWLAGLGLWAPMIFVALYVALVSAGFPASVLGFVAGATFGLVGGLALLLVAALLTASVIFALSRRWLSGRVRAHAASRARLTRFLELAEADSWRVMVLMRFSPLNFAVVCYLLGASRVRFWPYLITSLCVLPSAALQSYVGWTARKVGAQAATGGRVDALEVGLAVLGILAALALLVITTRLVRRVLDEPLN